MEILAQIMVAVVALEHVFILWIEMFAWLSVGKKVFGQSMPEHMFEPTKKMAANQGLYNGFLAAGLIWSFFISDANWQHNVSVFFLSCVIVAGVYGALSVSKKIFFTQALPAIVALLFVMLS